MGKQVSLPGHEEINNKVNKERAVNASSPEAQAPDEPDNTIPEIEFTDQVEHVGHTRSAINPNELESIKITTLVKGNG